MNNRELAEQEFAVVAAQLTDEELNDLNERVVEGMIDGGSFYDYESECGCFYGSIGILREVFQGYTTNEEGRFYRNGLLQNRQVEFKSALATYDSTALEVEILMLDYGSTPETDERAAWLHGLLSTEIARRQ